MGRRCKFDAEGLAEAGLAVARQVGWSGLTTRAVAAELGVSAMALYRVVPDAARIQQLVADLAGLPLVPQPSDIEGDLVTVLGSWAETAYRRLGATAGLASYLMEHWTELPSWLSIVESFLQQAASDGLHGVEAVGTVNTVFAYVLARAQLRDSRVPVTPRALRPVSASPERFPLIVANRAEFATAHVDRYFAFGLEVIMSGLRMRTRSAVSR